MLRFLIVSLVALALSSSGDAAGRRRVANLAPARMTVTPTMPASVYAPIAAVSAPASVSIPVVATSATTAAFDDLNGQRAQRGLRPYAHDPSLTVAALAAANYRASMRLAGHVTGGRGDFQFLPAGTSAVAAGCAAWPTNMPFGACGVFDNYRACGAASVRGADGLMYHHAFYK